MTTIITDAIPDTVKYKAELQIYEPIVIYSKRYKDITTAFKNYSGDNIFGSFNMMLELSEPLGIDAHYLRRIAGFNLRTLGKADKANEIVKECREHLNAEDT